MEGPSGTWHGSFSCKRNPQHPSLKCCFFVWYPYELFRPVDVTAPISKLPAARGFREARWSSKQLPIELVPSESLLFREASLLWQTLNIPSGKPPSAKGKCREPLHGRSPVSLQLGSFATHLGLGVARGSRFSSRDKRHLVALGHSVLHAGCLAAASDATVGRAHATFDPGPKKPKAWCDSHSDPPQIKATNRLQKKARSFPASSPSSRQKGRPSRSSSISIKTTSSRTHFFFINL